MPHLRMLTSHRCLPRHAISRLPDIEGGKPKHQRFKRYPTELFHMDHAKVEIGRGKLYLFIGIDCTIKFAVTQLGKKLTGERHGSSSNTC